MVAPAGPVAGSGTGKPSVPSGTSPPAGAGDWSAPVTSTCAEAAAEAESVVAAESSSASETSFTAPPATVNSKRRLPVLSVGVSTPPSRIWATSLTVARTTIRAGFCWSTTTLLSVLPAAA